MTTISIVIVAEVFGRVQVSSHYLLLCKIDAIFFPLCLALAIVETGQSLLVVQNTHNPIYSFLRFFVHPFWVVARILSKLILDNG